MARTHDDRAHGARAPVATMPLYTHEPPSVPLPAEPILPSRPESRPSGSGMPGRPSQETGLPVGGGEREDGSGLATGPEVAREARGARRSAFPCPMHLPARLAPASTAASPMGSSPPSSTAPATGTCRGTTTAAARATWPRTGPTAASTSWRCGWPPPARATPAAPGAPIDSGRSAAARCDAARRRPR
jgi:hypothetical protein